MKVCRTCLQVLSTDVLSVDTECSPSIRSKLLVCVPELTVDVQCTVICTSCSDALNTAYDFKNKCLKAEQKIMNYIQFTGCSNDAIDISEVIKFDNIKEECDSAETRQQLTEVHYPITEIIEQDTELDIKPAIADCDTTNGKLSSSSLRYYYKPANIKRKADSQNNKAIVNNTSEHKLLKPVFFRPELDVELRGHMTSSIDLITQSIQLLQGNQESLDGENYECTFCQKSFIQMSELEAHLTSHSETRPLKCTMCERRFARKDKLMLHMRIHTGEKPYECTLCGRCFSRKDKLNDHMRTHTGEKPHQCVLCHKCFARKDKMNTHMRSQHWTALSNLEITVVKDEAETNNSKNVSIH